MASSSLERIAAEVAIAPATVIAIAFSIAAIQLTIRGFARSWRRLYFFRRRAVFFILLGRVFFGTLSLAAQSISPAHLHALIVFALLSKADEASIFFSAIFIIFIKLVRQLHNFVVLFDEEA